METKDTAERSVKAMATDQSVMSDSLKGGAGVDMGVHCSVDEAQLAFRACSWLMLNLSTDRRAVIVFTLPNSAIICKRNSVNSVTPGINLYQHGLYQQVS